MLPNLPAVARLRRHLQCAQIRSYVRKYEASYSRPALRQQLLAAGYDPHTIDLAMAQLDAARPARTPGMRLPFGIAFGASLLGNVLVFRYAPRYWAVVLVWGGVAAASLMGAMVDPVVASRWSRWYIPPPDAPFDEARMQRQAERAAARGVGCGILVGALVAVLLTVVLGG